MRASAELSLDACAGAGVDWPWTLVARVSRYTSWVLRAHAILTRQLQALYPQVRDNRRKEPDKMAARTTQKRPKCPPKTLYL